jgi:predicted amidohydrolase
MRDLTVTLIQTVLHWEDIDANLAMFTRKIDTVDPATDLIVLPEMFTTGFSMQADTLAQRMDGSAVAWLRRTATQKATAIVGSMIIEAHGNFYNRLVWAGPDEQLFIYDKKHLFRFAGEEKVYTSGSRLLTVEIDGWKIRPFICYDLRFPAWTRNIGPSYDVALFVANWPEKRSLHWRTLLRARAIENQCYVIGLNRVGKDGRDFDHSGDSAVVDATGQILFEKSHAEVIHTATLSYRHLQASRQTFPAWMDADHDLIDLPD